MKKYSKKQYSQKNLFLKTTICFFVGLVANVSSFAGDNLSNFGRGLPIDKPIRTSSFTAAQLTALLSSTANGKQVLALAGAPQCGVDVHYVKYFTVGAKNEKVTASAALMVPTGDTPTCKAWAKPIVLYGHATAIDKAYNLAVPLNSAPANASLNEAALITAVYAAQGFIVVAPNYAGYDQSTLPYHPFANIEQQAKDMIDGLTAARISLPFVHSRFTFDNGKLFITGFSQGGNVAMATHRMMQKIGMPVVASAPSSGAYALNSFGDAIFSGRVNRLSTILSTLVITGFQKAYGNLYKNPNEVFEPQYAATIDSLLPSATPNEVFTTGKLPKATLFSLTPPAPEFANVTPPKTPAPFAPLFAAGFGNGNLITNSARLSYLRDMQANPDGGFPSLTTGVAAVNPANPIRQALKRNDLRDWTPNRPVMLCGGNADPTIYYGVNTQGMQAYWSAPKTAMKPGLLTVVDIDSQASGTNDPFAGLKLGFAQSKSAVAAAAVAAGAKDGGASAVLEAYHGGLVGPFCQVAARGFFLKVHNQAN